MDNLIQTLTLIALGPWHQTPQITAVIASDTLLSCSLSLRKLRLDKLELQAGSYQFRSLSEILRVQQSPFFVFKAQWDLTIGRSPVWLFCQLSLLLSFGLSFLIPLAMKCCSRWSIESSSFLRIHSSAQWTSQVNTISTLDNSRIGKKLQTFTRKASHRSFQQNVGTRSPSNPLMTFRK